MEAVLRRARARSAAQLAVVACIALATLAVAVRYPQALEAVHAVARANAGLSYADRELGGGNAVLPEQEAMYQARARIPPDGAYEAAVGPRVEGWTELTADYAAGFALYFLLPRRQHPGAEWLLCFNCDRRDEGGVVVWEGEAGVSLLRRMP